MCKYSRKLLCFWEFFFENIWMVLKNVVPLHPLSLKNDSTLRKSSLKDLHRQK